MSFEQEQRNSILKLQLKTVKSLSFEQEKRLNYQIQLIEMFDFEKLEVYSKAKQFNSAVSIFLDQHLNISRNKKDQLERAAFSIMLNIAEGTGRFTKPDKKNFYIIARGSAFECVAIFDYLSDQKVIEQKMFMEFYSMLEEISKMLFALIKSLI